MIFEHCNINLVFPKKAVTCETNVDTFLVYGQSLAIFKYLTPFRFRGAYLELNIKWQSCVSKIKLWYLLIQTL